MMLLQKTAPALVSTRRRQLLGLVSLGFTGMLTPQWAAAQTTQQHDAIRQSLGNAAVVNTGLELTLPLVAEDGSSVPLSIKSAELAGARIERLELYAPENPTPQIAEFKFGPEIRHINLSTRIRLNASQTVVAIAHTDDGRALLAERAVRVTVSGCVPPGKTDPTSEMQARVRVPKSLASNTATEVVTMISHPMITGLAADASGNTPAERIIEQFHTTLNGNPVLSARFYRSLAANPYLKFDLTPGGSGDLQFRWIEDSGRIAEHTETLNLA